MDKRKVIALSGSLIVGSMCLVGCSDSKNTNTDANKDKNTNNAIVEDMVEPPAEKPSKDELAELDKAKQEEIADLNEAEANKQLVHIWIPNVEYLSSGDETLEKLISTEVPSISEEEESDKYMRMLKTLNKHGDSPIQVVEFNSAKLEGDKLIIDMADATELGIGSTITEYMIIEQILLTVFDNFEEVNSVQFKVDGKIVDSFLGHLDITGAFSR